MKKTEHSLALYFEPSLPEGHVRLLASAAKANLSLPDTGPLAEIAESLKDKNVYQAILILPGEHIHCSTITLPNRGALKALPFLLEEQLAEPVENVHIAHSHIKNGVIHTLAINKRCLDGYLEQLDAQGIKPAAAYADYQLLPIPTGSTLNQCQQGSRTLLRFSDGKGTVLQSDQLELIAARLPSSGEGSQNLYRDSAEPLSATALTADNQNALNLLQGVYRPENSSSQRQWQKIAISSLAASFLLMLAYFLTAGWHFHKEADSFQERAEDLFLKTIPTTSNTENIKRRMEGYLKNQTGTSSNNGFLTLLAQCAPALKKPHQIRHIRFDQQQGTLQLEVQSSSNETINKLRKELEQQSLTAEVLSSTANDTGVLARLSVSGQG
ncbi:hypothetical protein KFE80_07460 [bacterium SCSIO 12696]|nr:hypothetical protein KFE80_07460 [bacterium SCSIO 12696]